MDEDLLRRNDIQNIILIGSVVMLTILDAFVLFHSIREGAAYQEVSFAAFSALPAFFILLYVLSRRGFHGLVSYLLIGAYLIADDYAAYHWGVRVQVVLIAYALIIVMATILRGTKFGFFITSLIAAYIIPLWYAQIHHIILMDPERPTADDALVFSILYFLIMIVAWLYDREIKRSLRRAKNFELALMKERDSLEVKVIERTGELRRTQFEKVRQLNRLAELGQLSSGLFHDILNLLNAISLRADDGTDPSLSSAFDTTRQIEGFVRAVRKQIGGEDERTSFSLTEAVGHVIQLVSYQANKEHVRISFWHDRRANITYYGAPFKFQEVVINLLLNAIESFDGVRRADGHPRTVHIGVEERGGVAMVRVEDNGCGMTSDVQARLFEPFFTTKDASKGIGIGLSTIKKIIEEDLAGAITVKSAPDKGSRFSVTFPIQHEGSPESDREGTDTREGETIP